METKAVRGFSWTFLGLGLSKGLGTVTTLVLAALVTPGEFGLVAVGLVVYNFVSWFGGSSFGATLIVHQDLDARGQGTVLSLSLLGAASAAVAILVLAPFVADLLRQPRATAVLSVLCISVVLSGVTAFYESLLQRELEFRRRFVALAAQTATFSTVSISLAAAGAGAWSLVVGQIASVACFGAVLVALAPRRVKPAWDRSQVGPLFVTGRGFALQGLTAFVRQNADTMAVGRAFGTSSVGFYAMAFRLGDLTYSALADPVARVTFPAFARSLARGEDIRPAFLSVVRVVALVTVPCGLILSAAADPFTRLFFSPEWAPMVGVLGVVGVWAAVRPIEATVGWLLNSLGRSGAVGKVAVWVLVPLAAALVLVVSLGEFELVALVPLADTLLYLGVLVVLVGRHAELPARVLGRALAPVVLAGAICWGATWLAARGLADAPALPALAGAVGAGLLAYGLAVLVLDRGLLRSTVQSVRQATGRESPADDGLGAAPGAPGTDALSGTR